MTLNRYYVAQVRTGRLMNCVEIIPGWKKERKVREERKSKDIMSWREGKTQREKTMKRCRNDYDVQIKTGMDVLYL